MNSSRLSASRKIGAYVFDGIDLSGNDWSKIYMQLDDDDHFETVVRPDNTVRYFVKTTLNAVDFENIYDELRGWQPSIDTFGASLRRIQQAMSDWKVTLTPMQKMTDKGQLYLPGFEP